MEAANKGLMGDCLPLRGQLKQVLEENSSLRQDLARVTDELAVLRVSGSSYGAGIPAGSMPRAGVVESRQDARQIDQYRTLAQLAQAERDALQQELAQVRTEAQDTADRLQTREQELLACITQHNSMQQTLKEAQQVLQTVAAERGAAEAEVRRLGVQVEEARQAQRAAEASLASTRTQLKEAINQAQDYRTAIEELSAQANVRCARANAHAALPACACVHTLPHVLPA
ncbi:MAG: hypothetical protein EOO41_04095 [Methanobacteriota archaeon]|nr:MAG: hypothetical protein EOO41_04095 [Euryarchaeota archaeon]